MLLQHLNQWLHAQQIDVGIAQKNISHKEAPPEPFMTSRRGNNPKTNRQQHQREKEVKRIN
jgi:hypothetical protein